MVTVDSTSEVVVDFSLEIDAIAMSDIRSSWLQELMKEHLLLILTIDKAEMEVRLGSQDIPMILNTTPSQFMQLNKVVVRVMLVSMFVVSTNEILPL